MLTVESSHFTVREDGGISKGARLINFIKTFLTSISHAEYTYIPYVLVGGTVVISVVEGDGCTGRGDAKKYHCTIRKSLPVPPTCLLGFQYNTLLFQYFVCDFSILLRSPCIVCVSNHGHTHFSVFSTLNFISIEGLISINKTDKSV